MGILAARDGSGFTSGASRARLVHSDEALPDAVDVVVVGGGNIGCMTALSLAERGIKVALCEKGVIAGEASGRSMGFVDTSLADPIKQPLLTRTKELWAGLNERVQADTGYRRSGMMITANKADDLAPMEGWLDAVKGLPGDHGRMLSSKEAAALLPGTTDPLAGAFYASDDASAEAQLFAPAVADALRAAGGLVFQNCAVRGIEKTNGRIAGVITEKGAIRCSAVVIAGGVWTPLFARSLGLDLPQFMGFSSNARLAPTGRKGPGPCVVSFGNGTILRRTLNGGYDTAYAIATAPLLPSTLTHLHRLWPAFSNLGGQIRPAINVKTFMWEWSMPRHWAMDSISPFEQTRILVPDYRSAIGDAAAAQIARSYPQLATGKIVERWAGALCSTLDNMPVMSGVAGMEGLYIGSGFYFGMTMAPAAGEALADLVMGKTPKFDMAPYRFSRFSDGSAITFRG